MIASFLTLRNKGLAIHDKRLANAFIIDSSRMRMPTVQYYAFGLHALEKACDPQLARQLFRRTVDNAGDEHALAQAIADDLARAGHIQEAGEMVKYANCTAGMGVALALPTEL